MRYVIRSSESGEVIEEVKTLHEAQQVVLEYNEIDREDGNYTEGFYEIYDTETEEIVE